MSVPRKELRAGAVVHDPTLGKLYEVRYTPGDKDSVVRLEDCAAAVDHPRCSSMLLTTAVNRLELIRHAPHPDDLASVLEWGHAGGD